MKYRLLTLVFSLLTLLFSSSSANAFLWWKKKTPKTKIISLERKLFPKSGQSVYFPEKSDINIAFVSGSYIYPSPLKNEKRPSPSESSHILYKEGLTIAQETIRDLIHINANEKKIDLVVFGGNQVANNVDWDLFQEVALDLRKAEIDYEFILAEGELTGDLSKAEITKSIGRPAYFYRKIKGLHIIGVDNVSEDLIPERLPEEASEQSLWIDKIFEEIAHSETHPSTGKYLDQEIFLFSHKKLDRRSLRYLYKNIISRYANIKFRLIANSGESRFVAAETSPHLFFLPGTSSVFVPIASGSTDPGTIYLSNTNLSSAPCAYTLIERKANADVQIDNAAISLRSIRKKAEEAAIKFGSQKQ